MKKVEFVSVNDLFIIPELNYSSFTNSSREKGRHNLKERACVPNLRTCHLAECMLLFFFVLVSFLFLK